MANGPHDMDSNGLVAVFPLSGINDTYYIKQTNQSERQGYKNP